MKISIGIVCYKKQKYSKYLLFSLLNQKFSGEIEILFRDNDENLLFTKEIKKYLENYQPKKNIQIKFFEGKNELHSISQNFLMKKSSGDVYICGSEDMFYGENIFENIFKQIQAREEQIFGVKTLNWDFDYLEKNNIELEKKEIQKSFTKKIDSFGILVKKNFVFEDIFQGKFLGDFVDKKLVFRNAFNFFSEKKQNEVFYFGVSGALIIFKKEIIDFFFKKDGFVFDEKFINHYKNDIDLAFRISLNNLKIGIIDEFVYHDRQLSKGKKTLSRSDFFLENSLFGNLVLLYRYLFFYEKKIVFCSIFREIFKFFYLFIFRTKSLRIYFIFFKKIINKEIK